MQLLQKNLFYQLNERISFVAPPDAPIAALMFELGNITLALGQYQFAMEIYRLAQDYGYTTELCQAKYMLKKKRAK